MLYILQNILMYTGAVISMAALLILLFLAVVMVNEERKTVFKHRSNDRFATKLFKKIEEYRNDFA